MKTDLKEKTNRQNYKPCNIYSCWKCHPEKKEETINRKKVKQNLSPKSKSSKSSGNYIPNKSCQNHCKRCQAIKTWLDKIYFESMGTENESEEEEPLDDFNLENDPPLLNQTNTKPENTKDKMDIVVEPTGTEKTLKPEPTNVIKKINEIDNYASSLKRNSSLISYKGKK